MLLSTPAPARGPRVEAADGRTRLEEPEASLARRSLRCAQMADKARRFRSESSVEGLLFCLSHPDPYVRIEALHALSRREFFLRPDFEEALLPKFKRAVEEFSLDPSHDVRYAAGDLSRDIEHWENFDSPRATAARRTAERRRIMDPLLNLGMLLLVVAAAGLLLKLVLDWARTPLGG